MTPFEQGYAAFLKGLQRDENPFDKETGPYSMKRWTDGWNACLDKVKELNQ